MNNNKKFFLFDGNQNRDKCSFRDTRIIVKNHDNGEDIFIGRNKVIVSGSTFTAAKHFNLTPNILTTSYNNVLALDKTVNEVSNEGPGLRKSEIVCLFAIGTNGCGIQPSQVEEVDPSKWIDSASLVPFRYQRKDNDLTNEQRERYFGRKTTDDRIVYYFKKFDNEPKLIQQYSDGTPIEENIYANTRQDEVEIYVELNLTITKEDCRDFFKATTGGTSDDSLVNTISLLTAWKTTVDGFDYYQDIRPLTKYNFPNEYLIDPAKGLDIVYQIFY